MAQLDGKVAFITGAARGLGRSHAVRLATEGADIIALDLCADIASVKYELGTTADLAETARLVEALGRRIHTVRADVRQLSEVEHAYRAGVEAVGPVDIVVANAGIVAVGLGEPDYREWTDTLDVNLTGAYNTVKVAIPDMVDRGVGGSIVLISSTAGLNGVGGDTDGGLAYTATKHALVGLMRAWANYLAPHSIRVNSIHPTAVNTPMGNAPVLREYVTSGHYVMKSMSHPLPIGAVDPEDVSEAVLYLTADSGRYVTGTTLAVDGGATNQR